MLCPITQGRRTWNYHHWIWLHSTLNQASSQKIICVGEGWPALTLYSFMSHTVWRHWGSVLQTYWQWTCFSAWGTVHDCSGITHLPIWAFHIHRLTLWFSCNGCQWLSSFLVMKIKQTLINTRRCRTAIKLTAPCYLQTYWHCSIDINEGKFLTKRLNKWGCGGGIPGAL